MVSLNGRELPGGQQQGTELPMAAEEHGINAYQSNAAKMKVALVRGSQVNLVLAFIVFRSTYLDDEIVF